VSIVYFDPSAFVKLLVDEPESDATARLWDHCGTAISSRLAYPEVRAALAAAGRARRLTPHALRRAEADWEGFWEVVRVVGLTAAVAREAGHLAKELSLKGADAIHLASVLAVGAGDTLFAVWDERLREAAARSGVRVTRLR
jgi:predicted nucleic acid-binding protein